MKRKRRIVWLIDSLRWGGAEATAATYVRALSERYSICVGVLQGHEGSPLARSLEGVNTRVDTLDVGRVRNPVALAKVGRYLRAHRAELVHTHLQLADILGTNAARLLRIPSVSTRHALDEPVRGTRGYWRLRLVWASLRRADRVIAVSEYARKRYVAEAGIDPARTVTIHNGINLRLFGRINADEAAKARESLGLREGTPVLMSVSVLREEKGLRDMIEALPTILESVPDLLYVLVGGGRQEEELRRVVHTAHLNEHVVFARPRHDVPALLAIADTFVLPTHGDLLPTVVMEAMAAGRPIVATSVGGIPEMIEHGQSGILVRPQQPAELAEACVRLLSSPAEARAVAEQARRVAWERFDIDRQAARVASVYDELMDGS